MEHIEQTKQIQIILGLLDTQTKTLSDLNESNSLLLNRIKELEDEVSTLKLNTNFSL